MTRTIFGKVMWEGSARVLAIGVAVSTALALCLLAFVAVQPAEAAFPGNNGKIAFQSDRDGPLEIYTIGASGGEATRITFRTGGHSEAAYSPDGSRIAFNSGGDIHVMKATGMNPDGTGSRALTTTGGAEMEPAWSPDGTRIAFVSNTFALEGETTDPLLSDPEIWVMNADGSGSRPLTENAFPETDPAWSPDGTTIAFESSRRPEPFLDTDDNIYAMDADGTNQRNLTASICSGGTCSYQGHDNDPAWSPDGEKIAYVHAGETGSAGGRADIWTMDPDGTNRTPLTGTKDVFDFMPAWSPDGTKIAYVRYEPDLDPATTENDNIAVMNADGTGQREIDNDTADDGNPDWQPIPVCTQRVNAANDALIGTAGKDVLCGDSRNNTINGAGGNDIVLAQGGNDRLTGALGNDTLNGGPGTDTALYSGTTAVRANLTTEFATGVGSDVLLGIENLSGSSAGDRLIGNDGRNVLSGLGGNDILDARDGISGNDKVDGGTGASDTCRRDAGDTILNCR